MNQNVRRQGTAQPSQPVRVPSLREELAGYNAGLVAELNVGGKSFFNAAPKGVDDEGKPNAPYWQFSTGMRGHLIRLRDVGGDFKVPAGGKLTCSFRAVRVTDYNENGTVRRVTIAVTGKPTDMVPNCRIKATGNAETAKRVDGDQLIVIDNQAALMIYPIVKQTAAA